MAWSVTFRLKKFTLVKRISWHACHKKCLADHCISTFHIALQYSSLALEFKVWPRFLLPQLTSNTYANLIENNPLLASHQVTLSPVPKMLKEFLQIVIVASSFMKIWEISCASQVFDTKLMRLATLALLSNTLTVD